MTVWIIEPRDPLIARDGKPFGVGVRAATLPFPFPSTTTGTVRTRAGRGHNGIFDPQRQINGEGLIEKVKQIKVRGPLLVELNGNDANSGIRTWLMPSPLDASLLRANQDEIVIQWLVPLEIGRGLTNLTQAPHGGDQLVPVGATIHDRRKSYEEKDAPRFWQWDQFSQWLLDPDSLTKSSMKPQSLGYPGLHAQMRTHVAIDPQKLTAFDGQLFQTRGLEFTHGKPDELKISKRLALALAVDDAAFPNQLRPGLSPLGGESRIAAWRESESAASFPNDCLSALQDRIAQDKACRLILLTPAYFANGSSPTWLRQHPKVKVELKAIATSREQVVSGWDYALVSPQHRGGMPKPTRRLVPAGAVYFLSLTGKDADIKHWVKDTWMQCVCDDDAHRDDGFGLAALGVWVKDAKLSPVKWGEDNEKTA